MFFLKKIVDYLFWWTKYYEIGFSFLPLQRQCDDADDDGQLKVKVCF